MSTIQRRPFSIDVREIVHRPGTMREVDFDVELPERWGEGLVALRETSEVSVDARLESVHEGILATGTAAGVATGECGRCLEPIELSLNVVFQDLFAYPGKEASDFEVQDDHVDLESLIRDALVLSLPFQPVCEPDCPGLDPETGEKFARRPEGEAQHDRDPRWAALAGFGTDQGDADDDTPIA